MSSGALRIYFIVLLLFVGFYFQCAYGATLPPTNLPKPQIEPRHSPPTVTPEMEEKIVGYFSEGQCENALAVISPPEYLRLSALPLAVVAYCEPKNGQSEQYFKKAEELEPSSDTIYVLHARYRWKKDPISAEDLWKKVLFLARTESTKRMAEEYLAGFGHAKEEVQLAHELTWFSKVQVGLSSESNPGARAIGTETGGSTAGNIQLSAGATKGVSFGSLAANYNLVNNRYFTHHEDDLMEHDLEVPISLRAGRHADVVFRPFTSYLTLGDSGLQVLGGLGIMGVSFHDNFKQSVQGIVYEDHYYVPDLRSQAGYHYRFEYDLQFFPTRYQLHTLFYFEHVSAGEDADPVSGSLIPYSHNDIGVHAFFDYDFKFMILSFYPKFQIREDDYGADYISTDVGPTNKQRQDISIALQPNATFRLTSGLQFFAWYEWSRTFSNIGPADYQDHNVLDQTFGIALKGFMASY